MKHCNRCSTDKPLSEFYVSKGNVSSYCKPCTKIYNREQYQKHKDKRRAYDKKRGSGWGRTGREKYFNEHDKWGRHILRQYGLTEDEFYQMLANQGGVCKICKGRCNRSNSQRLCIDHDHKTGKVRGLLCFQCNVGLGKFKDDPALLLEAANYLKDSE